MQTIYQNPIQAAVFDLDGTLVDSMWVWNNLLSDFLKARGIDAPAHMLNDVTHMSIAQSSAYVRDYFHLPMTAEEVLQEWRNMVYLSYAEKIQPKPGVTEYLQHLKDHGIPMAIATSCDPILCEVCLKRNGLLPFFKTLTYADQVGKGKASPDIYLECLRRLACKPENAVLFEDILIGLRTGKSIGMKTVAIEDPSAAPDWAIMKKEADVYIHDFYQLLEKEPWNYQTF